MPKLGGLIKSVNPLQLSEENDVCVITGCVGERRKDGVGGGPGCVIWQREGQRQATEGCGAKEIVERCEGSEKRVGCH